jgi:biopolymer transport protein ExbB
MAGDHDDRVAATGAADANAREEVVELEKGIALLEVIIAIAPLLGLLGTVSGLVGVFTNLDAPDAAAGRAEVARGIAEALYTTIGGLVVAVPTVIAHSYFTRKLERMGARMEVLIGSLLNALHRRGGSAPREISLEA